MWEMWELVYQTLRAAGACWLKARRAPCSISTWARTHLSPVLRRSLLARWWDGDWPQQVDRVLGVVKAFQTRVGAGPFPTELEGDAAVRLRGTGSNPWDEFGTTTGRPRRVGWLDLVLLRYAVRVNGLTGLVLTKLDILSGMPSLRVCTAYRYKGAGYRELPFQVTNLAECEPVYEELPGWQADVSEARTWSQLPQEAQAYVQKIASEAGVPVHSVSVGAERDQVVMV
jgi:adenylosuccinate synthase